MTTQTVTIEKTESAIVTETPTVAPTVAPKRNTKRRTTRGSKPKTASKAATPKTESKTPAKRGRKPLTAEQIAAKLAEHDARVAEKTAANEQAAAIFRPFAHTSTTSTGALSIPVKPVKRFSGKMKPSAPHANARTISARQAGAILAMLSAQKTRVASFDDAPTVNRVFSAADPNANNVQRDFALENGCAADSLRAGSLTLVKSGVPATEESYVVTVAGIRALLANFVDSQLRESGVFLAKPLAAMRKTLEDESLKRNKRLAPSA